MGISTSFIKKLIDSMTSCTQLVHFGSLSMKANGEVLMYLFRRLTRMVNLETSFFWFREIEDVECKDDEMQIERLFGTIYSSVTSLSRLRSLSLMMPFDFDEDEVETLKYSIRSKNKRLELSIEPNLDNL
jgi:hypothetical protein